MALSGFGSVVLINQLQIVAIQCGVIGPNPSKLRYEALSVPALNMDQQIDGFRDAAADSAVGQLHAGLENASCKPRQGLRRRVGMQRGAGAGMARVERLQQIEGLAATHLAHKNPVGPQAKRGPEKVTD